jgi:hypothetical protein
MGFDESMIELIGQDGARLTLSDEAGVGGLSVRASCGWADASFRSNLGLLELAQLVTGLDALIAADSGAFSWTARENWVALTFVMAKRGELHLSVVLQQPPDYLHELRLFLNLKQSDLGQIRDGFRSLD